MRNKIKSKTREEKPFTRQVANNKPIMSSNYEKQKRQQIIANSLENQDYLLISSLNFPKATQPLTPSLTSFSHAPNQQQEEEQAITMNGTSSVAEVKHRLLRKYCGIN